MENRDTFARAELANTTQVLEMLLRALEEGNEATTSTFVDLAERTLIKKQKFFKAYKD